MKILMNQAAQFECGIFQQITDYRGKKFLSQTDLNHDVYTYNSYNY